MTYSLQRVGLACFGALGTIGLLALAACPGNLENPEQVIVAPAGAGSTGTAGGGGGDMVDLTCVTSLFGKSCNTASICHQAGAQSGAGLDLSSPNFAARLVGVDATHKDGGPTCTPSKLIDTANPSASWLLAKINGGEGMCGSAMPIGPVLSAADKACITKFVNDEAAAHAGASTGTAGAGTGTAGATAASASSGGSGGASAGSGGM